MSLARSRQTGLGNDRVVASSANCDVFWETSEDLLLLLEEKRTVQTKGVTSNKCIASSNRCLTSSNKKLLVN